jgi:hypothetical protein
MPDLDPSPVLGRIEQYSSWLTNDAETIRRNVRALGKRPGFETKANAAMQLAKTRLVAALKDIDGALEEYAATATA